MPDGVKINIYIFGVHGVAADGTAWSISSKEPDGELVIPEGMTFQEAAFLISYIYTRDDPRRAPFVPSDDVFPFAHETIKKWFSDLIPTRYIRHVPFKSEGV